MSWGHVRHTVSGGAGRQSAVGRPCFVSMMYNTPNVPVVHSKTLHTAARLSRPCCAPACPPLGALVAFPSAAWHNLAPEPQTCLGWFVVVIGGGLIVCQPDAVVCAMTTPACGAHLTRSHLFMCQLQHLSRACFLCACSALYQPLANTRHPPASKRLSSLTCTARSGTLPPSLHCH